MAFYRNIETRIRSRLDEDDALIQVVFGPRQVGKSTAIKQALAGRGVYESADSPTPLPAALIETWWKKALQQKLPLLAIDEVQKIRGWSEVIKKLWDQKPKQLKLILSGSAALAIERDLKESLAGRYELIRAEHWNFAESNIVFQTTLRQFVEFGCYPGSIPLLKDPERWASYIRESIIEPVIGRDILQLHPVQNPALLRQVFGIAASLPAQIVSLHKIQGQLQDRGAVATLHHYLELLTHGFIVTGLQKYSERALRSKNSPPKLIVHDNALIRALERPVHQILSPERFGHYFENAVASRFLEAGWDVYYWSERNLEVDLIALGPNGEKLAIEVKTSETSLKELKALSVFCARHPQFQPCLVSFIDQPIPGIINIPAIEALSLSRSQNKIAHH